MTRFLVPPLHEKMGTLRGCTGFDMQDGSRYRANRRGAVDVERTDHAAAIKRDPNIAGDIVEQAFHARDDLAGRPGRYCSQRCDRTEYQPWTASCPRCGAPTETVDG